MQINAKLGCLPLQKEMISIMRVINLIIKIDIAALLKWIRNHLLALNKQNHQCLLSRARPVPPVLANVRFLCQENATVIRDEQGLRSLLLQVLPWIHKELLQMGELDQPRNELRKLQHFKHQLNVCLFTNWEWLITKDLSWHETRLQLHRGLSWRRTY